MIYITIGILGVLGVFCRFFLGNLNSFFAIPIGTLTANLIGCFLIGFIATTKWVDSSEHRLILAVGFLGALTTLSGVMLEMLKMLDASRWGALLIYFLLTNLGGLTVCYLGRTCAERF